MVCQFPGQDLNLSGIVFPEHASTLRVIVISPVRLYRDGLAALLGLQPGLVLISAVAYPDHLTGEHARSADAVIVEASGPHGPAVVLSVRAAAPHARILAITINEVDADILAYAEAGVDGFIDGNASAAELRDALADLVRGHTVCPASVSRLLLRHVAGRSDRPPRARLTNRENEIMALIDEGLSNKQIARRLTVTVPTVKNHVHNILQKLGVERRAAAAALLRQPSTRWRSRTSI